MQEASDGGGYQANSWVSSSRTRNGVKGEGGQKSQAKQGRTITDRLKPQEYIGKTTRTPPPPHHPPTPPLGSSGENPSATI